MKEHKHKHKRKYPNIEAVLQALPTEPQTFSPEELLYLTTAEHLHGAVLFWKTLSKLVQVPKEVDVSARLLLLKFGEMLMRVAEKTKVMMHERDLEVLTDLLGDQATPEMKEQLREIQEEVHAHRHPD